MDDRKQKSRIAFDAQAPTYDSAAQGAHARGLYPHVLAALARIPRGGELLDVGCGTGALAAPCAQAGSNLPRDRP